MRIRIATVVSACAILCSGTVVQAQWSFLENFNGGFDNTWGDSPALPTVGRVASLEFIGAPMYAFETLDDAQVLRLTNLMDPGSRCGLVSTHTLAGTTGEVEARVNTLVQNSETIDGLFELWLINPDDPSKYVAVVFHSGRYSEDRLVLCFSSEDETYEEDIGYENNTWYLFRITATPTLLRLSIWDDAGENELFSHDTSHTLAALGENFRIAIGQHIDSPDGAYTADSAVDYVEARADFVPAAASTWSEVRALYR